MKFDSAFLSYLALRATAAAGALLAGVCQTYTFARVLDAHRFSLFIVIGNLGLSLWLFDLGIAKVLYVNLRERFLGGRLADEGMGVQAMAVVAAYGALVVVGGIGVGLMWACGGGGGGWAEAVDFALFFIYSALNLVWFALRNISSATDQYLYFEGLEAARRVGHLALMFCLLAALPFTLFLLLSNAVWLGLLVVICARLRRRGGLAGRLGEAPSALATFFRGNRSALLGSGGYAAGEMIIYNFPSVLVPAVHGLGAPTIIFDTVFKIFRGATVLFAAACDLLVPRQTQAYAQRDHRQVRRATAFAFALAAVPALALCILLLVAGDRVYALLLGGRVTVPSSFTPLLVGLIVCNLFQTVSNYLLVHTGFFPRIARLAGVMVLAMTAVAAFDAVAAPDIWHFGLMYAVVYAGGAICYVALALRHPLAARPGRGSGRSDLTASPPPA